MLDKLVTIQLDKERHMRLSLKGMIELKNIMGIDLFQGFKFSEASPENNVALIWACLIHEDENLTYDDILCILDINNYALALQAATDCLTQALTSIKGTKRPLPRKSQRG